MLAEPKASAGAGAGAAERANGTPPPPPPPGGAAAGGGPAAAGLGGGVAAGSRPRGERSANPRGDPRPPSEPRRGGDGDDRYDDRYDGAPNNSRGGFPPLPHQTPVLGSESRRRHHRTSRTSPTSSAESGGGIGGRGIGRSPVQNPVASPPPMPPGPPPGVFLGEAWMGDGAGARWSSTRERGGCRLWGKPRTSTPPPPPRRRRRTTRRRRSRTFRGDGAAPACNRPRIRAERNPELHSPRARARRSPATERAAAAAAARLAAAVPRGERRSGASGALSGGGGGGGVTRGGGGGGGGAGEVTTSADSDSVRSNGAAGHTRRAFVVLDKTVTQSHLESLFRDTCEGVITVELKTDGHSGKSRGFAYVTFESPAFVQAACERLNGRELPEGSGVRCKGDAGAGPGAPTDARASNGSNKRRSNGHGNGNGRGEPDRRRAARRAARAPIDRRDRSAHAVARIGSREEKDEDDERRKGGGGGGGGGGRRRAELAAPGPRKYSRLNSPSAGTRSRVRFPPAPDVRSTRTTTPRSARRKRSRRRRRTRRTTTTRPSPAWRRRRAGDWFFAVTRPEQGGGGGDGRGDGAGKVSLGVVPEEDTTAVLAEGDRTRLLEGGTDAEPSDGTSPDDALDKFEGDGDDGARGNRTRDLSDRDDEGDGAGDTTDRKPARRPGVSESEPAAGEVAGSIPPAPAACYFSDSRCPSPVTPSGTCQRRTARWRSCRCGRTVRPGGWSTSTRRARTPRSRRCTRRRFSASSCGCRDFRRTWLEESSRRGRWGGSEEETDEEGVRVRGSGDGRAYVVSHAIAHTHERKRERDIDDATMFHIAHARDAKGNLLQPGRRRLLHLHRGGGQTSSENTRKTHSTRVASLEPR